MFPGGKVDAGDFTHADQSPADAARRACVRETKEEAGLDVDLDELIYYAHWTTPPLMPKRFATWFFMVDISDDIQSVEIDGSEIDDHLWVSPQKALQRHKEQNIELLPPTFVSLTELSGFSDAASAVRFFDKRDAIVYEPHFAEVNGGMASLYAGDSGYDSYQADVPGARHRCIMVPGKWTYEYSG